MTKFVVINWNSDELIGQGLTAQSAINTAVDNSENDLSGLFEDIQAEQVGLYKEVEGVFNIADITFKEEK